MSENTSPPVDGPRFELLKSPPSDATHIRTSEIAQFHLPNGSTVIGQRWIGRKKGTESVWAIIPQYQLA